MVEVQTSTAEQSPTCCLTERTPCDADRREAGMVLYRKVAVVEHSCVMKSRTEELSMAVANAVRG